MIVIQKYMDKNNIFAYKILLKKKCESIKGFRPLFGCETGILHYFLS